MQMNYARAWYRVRGRAACVGLAGWLLLAVAGVAAEDEAGFEPLFDGKSLAGWQPNENPASWQVRDGAIVCKGPRSHLFYVGPDATRPAEFKNFHLKVQVMTRPQANSGIFFHTRFQPEGWPVKGYEMQVNNSHRDPVRSGSIYHFVKNFTPPAEDDVWYTQELIVQDKAMTVVVSGRRLFEYVEPPGVTGAIAGRETGEHKLSAGTFALQAHDPGSEVHYRSILVKRLP